MQSHVWAALVRQIPEAMIDKLSLVTIGGSEIALQGILRIEGDFMIVKGRLSGSQDAGRIFFVPYMQIDYVGSIHPLKDTEFEELFGGMVFPDVAVAAPATVEIPPPSPSSVNLPSVAPGSAPASYANLPNPGPPGSGAKQIIKSAVLERFRARNGSAGTPGSEEDKAGK